MAKHIYAGVDIGTDSVKVVVGEFFNKQFNILASSVAKSRGVKRGVIVDVDQAASAIRLAMDQCEELLGVKISSVVAGIPGINTSLYFVEGFTTITSEDRVVRGDDIIRAINSAAFKKQLLHSEIVNVLPLSFDLDDHKNIMNPKKMVGKRLGVRAVIVASPRELVVQTILAIERAGLNVLDITSAPIADALQVMNKVEYELFGTVVNIGHENTNVVVYEDHKIRGMITVHLGMKNVLNDIAFIYKVSLDEARVILNQYGTLEFHESLSDHEITTQTAEGKPLTLSEMELHEIIDARLTEILEVAYKEIGKITEHRPKSIVVSGGALQMEGFASLVDKVYGPIGRLADYKVIGARHPRYSTAIGIIKMVYRKQVLRGKLKLSLSVDAEKELVTFKKKSMRIDEESVLGKVFGFFFE